MNWLLSLFQRLWRFLFDRKPDLIPGARRDTVRSANDWVDDE